MGIRRINRAIEAARSLEQPPLPAGETLFVCHATEAEWNAFANADGTAIRANYLEWFEDLQEIHIVEFSRTAHAFLISSLGRSMMDDPHVSPWLAPRGASTNSHGRQFLPDLSFGPRRSTPNAVLPPGVRIWGDFKSIKVEVAVSPGWGTRQGQLDHKAHVAWGPMPGVEYVLCIKTDEDLAHAEYKLYDVAAHGPPAGFNLPFPPPLVAIGPGPGPAATISLDTRRVLGIPAGQPLPANCPSQYTVDLHDALETARSCF